MSKENFSEVRTLRDDLIHSSDYSSVYVTPNSTWSNYDASLISLLQKAATDYSIIPSFGFTF